MPQSRALSWYIVPPTELIAGPHAPHIEQPVCKCVKVSSLTPWCLSEGSDLAQELGAVCYVECSSLTLTLKCLCVFVCLCMLVSVCVFVCAFICVYV